MICKSFLVFQRTFFTDAQVCADISSTKCAPDFAKAGAQNICGYEIRENSKQIRCPYTPEKCEYRPCRQTHIFCFGESPSPLYSQKKILFELFGKRLDFIRLSDYNIIWIIIGRSEWDRSGPWNTYQSHRPLNDGVFPPGAYRFYVPKGVSQAPSALEQYGAFQMMSQSPQTQE